MKTEPKTINNKLIVILGPTASGKTDLSVKLAKKFNGEIISADSRQVYKDMDIGAGKITKKETKGIPHYLLSIASPKYRFTVAQYKKLAEKAIKKIQKSGKIPFLVGGTGLYIQAVVDGITIPEVKPDWQLRTKFEKKTAEELFHLLKKIDPRRAKTIDNKNKRRLIRALEIVIKTKKPVPVLKKKSESEYEVLMIGIKKSPENLKKLIQKRLFKRLKQGMMREVERLHTNKISWERLEEFGLEYRYCTQYLQKKIKYGEMLEKIQKESEHYAKRQMTWFSRHWSGLIKSGKKDKRIFWLKNYKEVEKIVKKFLG